MLAAAVPGRTPAIGVEVIGTGPGTPPPGDGIGWWDGEFPPLGFEVQPRYTRAGDPDGGVVPAGGPLDGVARLDITWPSATVGCSGALLQTGRHVLTAAHCLTDDAGALNVTSASVTFEGDGGTHSIPATAYAIHPDWDGNVLRGNGVAVVTLAMEAPAEIARYGLYTGTGEVGRLAEHGGLRGFGQGATGADPAAYPFGTKRAGLNVCDSLADLILEAVGFVRGVDFAPGAMLAYDFDNGDPANDAFGYFFGIAETGQGEDEVMSALGDSGGPVLIDGAIAGITSYGLRLFTLFGDTSDVDGVLNSSFGEFGVDMRVSYYADFIYGVLGVSAPGGSVPAPAPLALILSGLIALRLVRYGWRASPPVRPDRAVGS